MQFTLKEGKQVTFVLRDHPSPNEDMRVTTQSIDNLQKDTQTFWYNWISKSQYKGRWREIVNRSLLLLKLLIYEPTGAIIAAPMFSLPEDFGGSRNWEYRYSWVRDSSSLGLHPGGGVLYELHKRSFSLLPKCGRSTADYVQHSISLRSSCTIWKAIVEASPFVMGTRRHSTSNSTYMGNSWTPSTSPTSTASLFRMTSGLPCGTLSTSSVASGAKKDMSIWEVHGEPQNFVFSKVMLWVAIDRALRLADKRVFPCPQRVKWEGVRDEIYEDVMNHGYNSKMQCFVQSYEDLPKKAA